MTRLPVPLAACLVLLAAAPPPPLPPADTGSLAIRVGNVRNARGLVHVDLCDQGRFLHDDCPFAASVPARSPVTTVVVHGVPPGRYAAQLFHDENANGRTDRNFLGIPKEGIAFSRDAPIRLSPPKWADAQFAYPGGAQDIAVRMRYFLGPAGPKAR